MSLVTHLGAESKGLRIKGVTYLQMTSTSIILEGQKFKTASFINEKLVQFP